MSIVLNKHITIFTDNDMYHANVATLGNRSPILNERIINYILNLFRSTLPKHKTPRRELCVNTLDL